MNATELNQLIDRVAKWTDMPLAELRRAASVDASSEASMKSEFSGFTRGDLIRRLLEQYYIRPNDDD